MGGLGHVGLLPLPFSNENIPCMVNLYELLRNPAGGRTASTLDTEHKLQDVFDRRGPVDFVAVRNRTRTSYVSSSYLSAPLTAETTVQEGPPSPRTLSGSAPRRVRMVLGARSPRKCII